LVHLGFSGKPVLQFVTSAKSPPFGPKISGFRDQGVPLLIPQSRGSAKAQGIEVAKSLV
jgi:hypothetical protein